MWLLALTAVAVVAAIAIAVVMGDEPDGDDPAGDAAGVEADGSAPTAPELPPDCVNLHASHGIAMWNPSMADEMTAAGCPFPYDPFLPPLEGGEEDPSLTAPFEARMYTDLWQLLSAADLGLCKVTTMDEPSEDGLAFGFRYVAGPPGCPDPEGAVAMEVREYVTRPWRDAQAHASTSDRTFVLGRWVIGVAPTDAGDPAAVDAIATELDGLGAVELTG